MLVDMGSDSTPRAPGDGADPTWSRRAVIVGGAAAALLAGCAGDANEQSGARRGRSTTTIAPHDTAVAPTTAHPGATTSDAGGTGSSASTLPPHCELTPELTAGPYYLDGALTRSDITEGRPGTPLKFRVRVLDASAGCVPLVGAAVDIWHCDAGGEYSGFNGNSLAATAAGGTNDKRFLRGVQLTDASGIATFATIVPGWYEGRSVHIHLKVLEGGEIGDTYRGGHVAHVGQAFFDDALVDRLLKAGPYAAHTGTRTTNDDDSIFRQAGPGAITSMVERPGGTAGWVGDFTCIVDPRSTPPAAPLF